MAIIFVNISINLSAQEIDFDGYTKEQVQNKIRQYRGLRNTGLCILGVGVAALGTGIGLASSSSFESHPSDTITPMTADDKRGLAGIMMIVSGIPITLAGTVLTVIGQKKYTEYRDRITLFAGYDIQYRSIGIRITYIYP